MIKYVCDMCGKPLLENEDVRYVVRIDVYAAHETYDYPESYDDMDAADDVFDAMDDADAASGEDESYATFRFDLCPACHKRYLEDPLVRPRKRRIGFSDN